MTNGRPTVRGDLDSTNASRLEEWLRDGHAAQGAIDLSEVTAFDSSALRIFLRAVDDDPRVRIVNPSTAVTRTLRRTNTYDHLVDDLT
jgi:anti-anti-sigma factor